MNQPLEPARDYAQPAADPAAEMALHAASAAKDATSALKAAATDGTNAAKDAYQTLSSKVEDGVERTKEYAQHAVEATKDVAHRATDTAKDIYAAAALRAEDTLATSKDYVRQNPVPVVLGAIAFGAALGYLLVMARRKPTFSERYADQPLAAVREAILAAFEPVAQRVHEGYDSARDGAGKVMDRVHRLGCGRTRDSFSDQLGRIGNNLKFW